MVSAMFIYFLSILESMTNKSEKLNFVAKIIANNRITIPEVPRSLLELEKGDIIEVEIKRIVKKQEVVASV